MAELLLEQLGERQPESEIYGRSLSTPYRLGAFVVSRSLAEAIVSPEADQARAEFYTSVEEGFGTDEELGGGLEVRDFDERAIIDGRVMAKDLKTAVSSMTEDGLACAMVTAAKDERFLPQLTRSYWDHENALLVDKMARGETDFNTIIVVSPFVEEAVAQSGEEYWRDIGYVPHRKRGFVQLYHASGGTLLAGSLSFDGSDKRRLREVFRRHNHDIPEDEITDNWLKYSITGNLSAEEAKMLATEIADQSGDPKYNKKTTNTVDVTHHYGPVMDRVFNDSYVHICESLYRGYQTEGTIQLVHQLTHNAHHFNERYSKALYKMRANPNKFADDDSIVLHELLVYSTIELMRALHLSKAKSGSIDGLNSDPRQLMQLIDSASFQSVLSDLGAEGARHNRVYSACGLSISLGEGGQAGSPQEAYGGHDRQEILKCVQCPLCKSQGVDARITYEDGKKKITCSKCKKSKTYNI